MGVCEREKWFLEVVGWRQSLEAFRFQLAIILHAITRDTFYAFLLHCHSRIVSTVWLLGVRLLVTNGHWLHLAMSNKPQ